MIILYVVNVDWFFISHRLIIAEEAKRLGHKVFVLAKDTGRAKEISEKGIVFINFIISRSGINFCENINTLFNLYQVFKEIKPDIVHNITLKPVIYGSIISKLLKIRGVVNAISGLGFYFTDNRQSFVRNIILVLLRFGFNRKNLVVIFQNTNDQEELTNLGVINSSNRIVIIKGSGVNLVEYYESPFPSFNKIKILFPSRMLWDKGLQELKDSSNILKEKYSEKVEFILAGMADENNNSGVSSSFLKNWNDGNYFNWIGYKKNMLKIYQDSHIVVLPSYREGMPKSLLEACSVGRAIVTTNAIGCKETVDEGFNGFKVPIANEFELAYALEKLINNHDMIKQMGRNSRSKAVKEFDVKNVIEKHIEIYNTLLVG